MHILRDGNRQNNNEVQHITTTLSALWVYVMLNMLCADVLSFMDKTFLNDLMNGHAGSVHITSGLLLLVAVMLEVPIAMILLSKILSYRVNRPANIVAAVITIIFVVGGGSAAPHYIFFASLEILAMLVIIRSAWAWSGKENR